jgi:hypothetical protein
VPPVRTMSALNEIVVRPNDRVIRGTLVVAAMAWMVAQAFALHRDPSAIVFVPLTVMVCAALAWLLAWITIGRWVLAVSNGELLVDRRFAGALLWRTAYSIESIIAFRVEERRKKIKGNTSLRYRVLMDRVNEHEELAWYRTASDAHHLASQLQGLVSQARDK